MATPVTFCYLRAIIVKYFEIVRKRYNEISHFICKGKKISVASAKQVLIYYSSEQTANYQTEV